MQLGMIGLGRVGGNIVRRLMRNGHECAVFDRNATAARALTKDGATAGADLSGLVKKPKTPRAVNDPAIRQAYMGLS